ncbi:MAG: hypothetical protein IKH67_03075 [Lachnospiraceae bacterium]|nr:hypothetical protein [Lachnospiraceae bacterium]
MDKFFSYRTTGQFEKIRRGYKRHCGPTAITNLILTLRPELNAEDVFRHVVRIGSRHMIYWNMDLFHRFGGTSDFLTGAFIRMCLNEFGLYDWQVRFRGFVSPRKVKAAFSRGSILLVSLHFHPKYKNHHVLCYGGVMDRGVPSLVIADGWKAEKTLIPFNKLGFAIFFEVSPRA